MVVLRPIVKMSYSFRRGWRKPFGIDNEELEKAIEKVFREKIMFENRIIIPLKDDKLVAEAVYIYYNKETGKVNVTLLYPLLICEVER